jgi:hypothetical protein
MKTCIENVEVKPWIYIGMLPALHMIDGAKFDLNSQHNPNFQTTHSFGWGATQSPATYHFGAVFANSKVLKY